jgi:plastocyanin
MKAHLPAAVLLCLIPAAACAAGPPATGDIAGAVRFTGKVPPPEVITTTDGTTLEHHDLVVDGKTKGLRYVFAVLEDAVAQAKLAGAKPALVDQRDLLFHPRVLGVQHGRPVRFDNSDRFNHNVMASSTVEANQFNLTAPPGEAIERTLAPQKAPVLIGCSIHPWMRAWVYVVPHPWFAVSDAQGRFRIDGVPPGEYTLWLRHADTGLQERRKVKVEAGKLAEADVEWKEVRR